MLDGGGADTFLGESEIPSFTSLQKKHIDLSSSKT